MRPSYSRHRLGPQGYPFDDDPPPGPVSILREPAQLRTEPESAKVQGAAKRGEAKGTPGQRRRLKRNLLIYGGYTRLGFTQRQLAEVFDLPRSRIGEIIADCRQIEASRKLHV